MKHMVLFGLIYGTALAFVELDIPIVLATVVVSIVYLFGYVDGVVTGMGKQKVLKILHHFTNWVRGRQ